MLKPDKRYEYLFDQTLAVKIFNKFDFSLPLCRNAHVIITM